ncbi:MAG: AI-2E family transporter [Clostridiales bacterium]|nr:AI-2E family transporter [Clostridiales bacterium]
MELNKKNIKRILLLVACSIILYWALNNLSTLGKLLGSFFSLFSPLLIGAGIAYVMNLLLKAIERLWDMALKKAPELWRMKLKRPICLTATILLFLGIIFAIFFILIPRLEEAGSTLIANVPGYITQIQNWWGSLVDFAAGHGVTLPELSMNVEDATKFISKILSSDSSNVVNTTIDITTSILGALVNILLALVFSVYMLAQKETLISQSRRLLLAALPRKAGQRTMHILKLTNNAFSSFVTGQVTEAFILGSLCCIGMLILRLPYALPVSVIISFTSLIPIFGAWIGAATGAFLIVFVSPIKALTFLIFLLILQQVEGNLIYPKVVGKSVGLPGLWVLAAVTIGGGIFGMLGMLLGVPICSVIYALVQDFIRSQPTEDLTPPSNQ